MNKYEQDLRLALLKAELEEANNWLEKTGGAEWAEEWVESVEAEMSKRGGIEAFGNLDFYAATCIAPVATGKDHRMVWAFWDHFTQKTILKVVPAVLRIRDWSLPARKNLAAAIQ